MKFEIFYTGGFVVRGSGVDEWKKAPGTGVQAIVVMYPSGAQEKLYGFNQYSYDARTGTLYGDDRPLLGPAKLGELIADDAYAEIVDNLESRSRLWNAPSVQRPATRE